jgi:hypothetical protein
MRTPRDGVPPEFGATAHRRANDIALLRQRAEAHTISISSLRMSYAAEPVQID